MNNQFMTLDYILFFVFALVAAISAVIMITRNNPIISAIFLIINFFSLAGLYLLLNAQFISVVQVIVYAGAIMVLFLFVLMLINTKNETGILAGSNKLKIFAVIIAGIVLVQIVYLVFLQSPSKDINKDIAESIKAGTIENIGKELYTTYVLPFEAAGFLLVAATIGALVLAKKKFE